MSDEERQDSWKHAWLWAGVWMLAIAASLCVDQPLAAWVYHSGMHTAVKHLPVISMVRAPGKFGLTLAIAAAFILYDRRSIRTAATICLSGALAGLFYTVVKWAIGRHRPIFDVGVFNTNPFELHFFHGGLWRLFQPKPNLSFPSGHTCLAFATAAAVAAALPSWRWVCFAVAAAVGAERILEGAHYVSDTIAGAGLGILAWKVAETLMNRAAASRSQLVVPSKSSTPLNESEESSTSVKSIQGFRRSD